MGNNYKKKYLEHEINKKLENKLYQTNIQNSVDEINRILEGLELELDSNEKKIARIMELKIYVEWLSSKIKE